jgi:hypothetical protein
MHTRGREQSERWREKKLISTCPDGVVIYIYQKLNFSKKKTTSCAEGSLRIIWKICEW